MYVALEDASKHVATVVNPDTAITKVSQWTQWKIPLTDFAGVNAAKVKKIYIGVGNKAQPVKGGAGLIYIDDVCVTKP